MANNIKKVTNVNGGIMNLGQIETAAIRGVEQGNNIFSGGFSLGLQTVVAAGSDETDAGAIVAQGGAIVLCSTADNTKGVILPPLSSVDVGEIYIVLNNLSNKTLKVYPGSGDAINPLSDDAAAVLAADTMLICIAQDSVQWFSGELPVTAA
jgi:hypothetical protein